MKRLGSAIGVVLLALAPGAAQAHLMVSGLGPVYDGMLHFAASPEDFLPLVALAFLAGLRDPGHARSLFFTVPIAWLAGGALGLVHVVPSDLSLSVLTAALFLATGASLAADVKVPAAACAILGAVLGTVRGLADFSGVDPGATGLFALVGVCASASILCALAVSVTLPLERLWMVVAMRVYGSWIAALGVFLAGWIFRYGAVVR